MSSSDSAYTSARKQVEKYAQMMQKAQNECQNAAYRDALEKFSEAMRHLSSLPTPQRMRCNNSSYSSPYYGSGNINASHNSSYQGLCGTAEFFGIRCGGYGGSEGLNW